MPNTEDVKKAIEELRRVMELDIPDDDRGVLRGVLASMEEFLKVPYDEDASPFSQKKHYGTIYKKRVGKT
ncbi:MAG: hypothetical protein HY366_02550 [Candidatus Aenigmarchaeota archaeon]|nr:hypothetical protein [Candidatus Aenigmarchaeota archaeon]